MSAVIRLSAGALHKHAYFASVLLRPLHGAFKCQAYKPLIGNARVLRPTADSLQELLRQAKINGLVFALHLEPHEEATGKIVCREVSRSDKVLGFLIGS